VSPSLHGPRAKLSWAQEKLYGLQTEIHTAHTAPNNPYRVLEEMDMDSGEGVLRAVAFEPLPFNRWSLLLGDIVHAMRSALDHTAYQLGCLRKNPPGYTEFPVLTDPALWEERNSKGDLTQRSGLSKIRNLPRKAHTQIEALQPYKRGKLAHLDPLAAIHELDIIDKHRRLNLVGATLLGSRVQVLALENATLSYSEPILGAFKDGAKIGEFAVELQGDNPRVQVKHDFSFGVTLSESESLPEVVGQDAVRFVTSILPYVGWAISRFEKFFP
jgi:hypothetical protein